MATTEIEATPHERAEVIVAHYVEEREAWTEKCRGNLDALVTAIELFGGNLDTKFEVDSIDVTVHITVDDVNATLKEIHHAMRSIGWIVRSPFNKDGLTWTWVENWESAYPVIHFRLSLSGNASCKKVQVGTTEVPVYEIQCSDDGRSFDIEEPS